MRVQVRDSHSETCQWITLPMRQILYEVSWTWTWKGTFSACSRIHTQSEPCQSQRHPSCSEPIPPDFNQQWKAWQLHHSIPQPLHLQCLINNFMFLLMLRLCAMELLYISAVCIRTAAHLLFLLQQRVKFPIETSYHLSATTQWSSSSRSTCAYSCPRPQHEDGQDICTDCFHYSPLAGCREVPVAGKSSLHTNTCTKLLTMLVPPHYWHSCQKSSTLLASKSWLKISTGNVSLAKKPTPRHCTSSWDQLMGPAHGITGMDFSPPNGLTLESLFSMCASFVCPPRQYI